MTRFSLQLSSTLQHLGDSFSLGTLGRSLLLGVGSSLVLSTVAMGTEVIELYDQNQTETVTIGELETFAETGEIPEGLGAWLDTTERVPEDFRQILIKEIYIDPKFVKKLLESSTGEFVLLKLDEVINSSPAEGEIENVKTAVLDVYEDDNRLSILKLLAAYPVDTLRVDVDKVEGVYDDVKSYVEKVLPALDVAKEFLQDLLCDCEAPAEATLPEATGTSSESSFNNNGLQTTVINAEAKSGDCGKLTTTEAIQAQQPSSEIILETPIAETSIAETTETKVTNALQ